MVWEDRSETSVGRSRAAASRKFYDYTAAPAGEQDTEVGSAGEAKEVAAGGEDVVRLVADNVIGKDSTFLSPFGQRKIEYCDYTASGRSLRYIEDYLSTEVLPRYGSTHTTATHTAMQTTMFRHEARDAIRAAVRAGDGDRVLLCGSGATAAVGRLLHGLRLSGPPVLLAGPALHHSALLPWREAGATVERIREDASGGIDMRHLEERLQRHTSSRHGSAERTESPPLIGCFSAASNVTGVMADTVAVSVLLHRYGALAFWDYATAAPYVALDMNPVDRGPLAYKDAMFFSMHKFIGGVQTPGVLVAKRHLFRSPVPVLPGGGSVFFVSREEHSYLKEEENREEGGTPAIVESIRAGLVVQLKAEIGVQRIKEIHDKHLVKLAELISSTPNLIALGPSYEGQTGDDRLPILSFMVSHPQTGRYLHHNFVASVLNDVYGIQARGGCACAGPYAMDLLGLSETNASALHLALAEPPFDRHALRRRAEEGWDTEPLRPGFVRLNLPITACEEAVEFVLEAVRQVCASAWTLLPQYRLSASTGEWRHRSMTVPKDRRWLGRLALTGGRLRVGRAGMETAAAAPNRRECLAAALDLYAAAAKAARPLPATGADQLFLPDDLQYLRWFVLPSEARACLLGGENSSSAGEGPSVVPCGSRLFTPPRYPLSKAELDARGTQVWRQPPRVFYWGSDGGLAKQNDGAEIQNGGGVIQNGGGEIQNGGAEIRNGGGEIRNGGGEVKKGGGDFGADVINGENTGKEISQMSVTGQVHQRSLGAEAECYPNEEIGDGSVVESERKHLNTVEDRLGPGLQQNSESSKAIGDTDAKVKLKPGEIKELETVIENLVLNDEDQNEILEANYPNHKVDEKTILEQLRRANGITNTDPETLQNENPDGEKLDDKDSKGLVCDSNTCFLPRPEGGEGGEAVAPPGVKWHNPPKELMNPMMEAISQFRMIRPNDRVLVCLSGGKDSLSLMHLLKQYQHRARGEGTPFTLGAVTVDPESSSYDPRPLRPYLASLGLPYLYEQQAILPQALALPDLSSICAFCSRMKRGRLYAAARREGYNVLAFGQHLDDLAESFVMSALHNGRLRTMKAAYTVAEGDLRVIRPLVFCREGALRRFAETRALPVIPENCPACFLAPKERQRAKQLLAKYELDFPQVYTSLRTALLPLMAISETGLENALLGKACLQRGGEHEEGEQ